MYECYACGEVYETAHERQRHESEEHVTGG